MIITVDDCMYFRERLEDLENNIEDKANIIKDYNLNEYIFCIFYRIYFNDICKHFKDEDLDKRSLIDDFLEFGDTKISKSNNPEEVKKSLQDYVQRIKNKISNKYSCFRF